MNFWKRFSYLGLSFLTFSLISACNLAFPEAPVQTEDKLLAMKTPSPSIVPVDLTQNPKPPMTPIPTNTILPEASLVVATPTPFQDMFEISFDVTLTPFQISRLVPITPENAGKIELLAVLGGGEIDSLAWSPDSKFLAAGTSTGLKLYSAESPDAPPLQISPLTTTIGEVAFSPVSPIVVGEVFLDSAQPIQRKIQIWDIENGELLRDDNLRFERGVDIEFSPNGTVLAISGRLGGVISGQSRRIRLIDMQTGSLHDYDFQFERTFDMKFSPNGTVLAISAGSEGIQLIDMQTGSPGETLTVEGEARLLAFNPSGTLLASLGYRDGIPVVHLIDLENGFQIGALELRDRNSPITSFDFSPDGRTLAVGRSRSVELWEVENQTFNQELKPRLPSSAINTVNFSPDGAQLIGASSDDKKLWIWNVASGEITLEKNISSGNVSLSPNGKILQVGLELLEVSTWRTIGSIPVVQERVTQLVFKTDSQTLVAAYEGGNVRIWNIPASSVSSELTGGEASINDQVFSPDGQLVARADEKGTLGVWETETGVLINNVNVAGQARALKLSPDSSSVAFADAMGLRIWNFRISQEPILLLLWEDLEYLADLVFSQSGSALAASTLEARTDAEKIRVWNSRNGKLITTVETGVWGKTSKLAFNPDETLLAVGDPWVGTIGLYSLGTGNRLETLGTPPGDIDITVENLLFRPDGSALASVTSAGVTLWWVRASTSIPLAYDYKYNVYLAFNPSGSILTSGGNVDNNLPNSADGDLRLWDAATGTLLADLVSGSEHVFVDARFSPDGKLLAAASETKDDTIWIWGVLP